MIKDYEILLFWQHFLFSFIKIITNNSDKKEVKTHRLLISRHNSLHGYQVIINIPQIIKSELFSMKPTHGLF